MVGDYRMARSGLNFRTPVRIFAPLGWVAAGLLNPAGYFVHLLWGMPEFNYQVWAWHVAVPLELGLLFAMMFVREGGHGIGGIAGITIICVIAACAGTGPLYAALTWAAQQVGLEISVMGWAPIYTLDHAIAHTGTYIRASLIFAVPCAVPAVLILRLVAFQRVQLRKAPPTRA